MRAQPEMTALEPGSLLTSHLRLERLLSEGGMSQLWVARNLALRADVAVKLLSPELRDDVSAHARFELEAQLTAQVGGAHVARTYDYGVSDDGGPYIVMELLEGEDLHGCCVRSGPMPLTRVVPIVQQVASALARAHDQGIIHRDVKPSNIFLVEEELGVLAKLIDFGVAKRVGAGATDLTAAGGSVGTPHYMSPEQLLGDPAIDHRADIWSLAVVAFRALTGRLPSSSDTLRPLGGVVLGEAPIPLTRLRPDLPVALEAWFLRAAHFDPEQRFPTAREMAGALSTIAAAVPESIAAWAPGPDPCPPYPRPVPRPPSPLRSATTRRLAPPG